MSHENREDIFDRQAYGQNLADIARSLDWLSSEGVLIANGNRLRTTNTENLLSTRFAYDEQPRLFQVVENVNGSLTYLPDEDGIRLTIGSAQGDKIVHSTNEFFHYQSYRETQFGRGIVLPPHQNGLRCRCGGYYEDNGFYFERDENGVPNMVRRSKATGSVVNEVVPQEDWNVNTFRDGDNHLKNPSGIVLDFDLGQMWKGGMLWYGQGYIYMGFQIGMKIYIAHIFQGANESTFPIIGEPTVPLRVEMENVTATSSSSSLKTWGASAAVETSEFKDVGFVHTISNGTTGVSTNGRSGDFVRVMTIRPAATFKGKTNRTKIEMLLASVFATGQNHFYIVAQDVPMTNEDTANWQPVGNESAVEYALDVTGIDIDSGINRQEGYVAAGGAGGGGFNRDDADTRNPLVLPADGVQNATDNLAVFAKANATSGGTIYSALKWLEIQ